MTARYNFDREIHRGDGCSPRRDASTPPMRTLAAFNILIVTATASDSVYGDGYGHATNDGALSDLAEGYPMSAASDLAEDYHGRELQQAQCCSAGGIACFVAGCSVCAACQHCLGPQALMPWCWGCIACSGCAVGCTSYLHCAGASWQHCTNSPPPPSPRPPPPSGGHPSGSNWIEHNGMRRNFQMGPTTCTSPPCPLVLVMHGWTMSTANMVSSTQMNSRVSAQGRGGAVVVYPDGTGSGIQSCWRVQNAQPLGGCSNPAIDDVGYIAALIDLMISRYNVDMNRVYAMGFSNGGTMTLQLACFLNWKITAFGIVGAGPLTGEGGSHRFVDTWQCPHPNRRLSSPQAVSL